MRGEAVGAMPERDREFQFEEAEARRTIRGPGLCLTFTQVGPRWTHALSVGDGSGIIEVARTVEGDPDRDDPARVVSPAYQEIQPHASDRGIQALLMGQSGPHHFSAVVSVRREGSGVEVRMDVADRCRHPVAVFAGTYLVPLGSSALIDADPHRIVWGGDALGHGRLEFEAEAPNSVVLAEAGRQACRAQALASAVPSTFTRRLVYLWRWTPARHALDLNPGA